VYWWQEYHSQMSLSRSHNLHPQGLLNLLVEYDKPKYEI
jgi:hypothetical protein